MIKILIILITIFISSNAAFANYPKPVIEAIHIALDDEFKAYTTYKAYLNEFGDRRPFSNIIKSELRHIRALEQLLNEK